MISSYGAAGYMKLLASDWLTDTDTDTGDKNCGSFTKKIIASQLARLANIYDLRAGPPWGRFYKNN